MLSSGGWWTKQGHDQWGCVTFCKVEPMNVLRGEDGHMPGSLAGRSVLSHPHPLLHPYYLREDREEGRGLISGFLNGFGWQVVSA